jgi:hypothetical protein
MQFLFWEYKNGIFIAVRSIIVNIHKPIQKKRSMPVVDDY